MITWLSKQIKKMQELQNDPHRKEREGGANFGWNTPIGSIMEAYSKITRVVAVEPTSFNLVTSDHRYCAEECREAAHYLLRAASLLEGHKNFVADEEEEE